MKNNNGFVACEFRGVPVLFSLPDDNAKWDGVHSINPNEFLRKYGGVILLGPEKYEEFMKEFFTTVDDDREG